MLGLRVFLIRVSNELLNFMCELLFQFLSWMNFYNLETIKERTLILVMEKRNYY
jgi:hypothetical protein